MKTLKLSALLLGAGLMMAVGSTTLSAKCGSEASKCGAKKVAKCGGSKAAEKCGAGKCGGEKEAPKAAKKCGVGKCG